MELEMNKDYELPPLPEPDQYIWYSINLVESIRKRAIEPYAKRITELEAQIEADRQRRGEPVAWVKQDIVENQFINMRPRRIWWECNEGIGMPIFTAPQSAEPVDNECVANGESCSYGPHGSKGERQCKYCGETPAEPVGEIAKSEHGDYPVFRWKEGYKAEIGDKFYLAPQPAETDPEVPAMEAVMETVDPSTWPGLTATQRCALGRFAKPQPAEPVSEFVKAEYGNYPVLKWRPGYKAMIGDKFYLAPQPAELGHSDDAAVDRFAQAMKSKMEHSRVVNDRAGWEECSAEHLSRLLRQHVQKGDPVDVANFCMMLHQNGQRITPAEPVKVPSDDLAHEIWAAAQTAPGEGIEDAVERVAALLALSKEIVGYVSSDPKRLNQYMSKAQYESALPKNRVAFDIPVGPLLPTHHHGE